jgi:hypothetical protein
MGERSRIRTRMRNAMAAQGATEGPPFSVGSPLLQPAR